MRAGQVLPPPKAVKLDDTAAKNARTGPAEKASAKNSQRQKFAIAPHMLLRTSTPNLPLLSLIDILQDGSRPSHEEAGHP